jgi:negative regulator of flagellin synthesis FlgM
MQIFGATNVTNGVVQKVQQANSPTKANDVQSTSSPAIDTVDQLDISSEAKMLSQLKVAGEFRADKVADIRSQIAAGQYETQEKLDVAVNRILDELA